MKRIDGSTNRMESTLAWDNASVQEQGMCYKCVYEAVGAIAILSVLLILFASFDALLTWMSCFDLSSSLRRTATTHT